MNAISQLSHYRWFCFKGKQGMKNILKLFFILSLPSEIFQIGKARIMDWLLQLSTLPFDGRNSPISSLYEVNQFYKVRPCCHSEHGIELQSLLDIIWGGKLLFPKPNYLTTLQSILLLWLHVLNCEGKNSIIYKKPLLSIDKIWERKAI